jgi:hypothetical protein
LLVQFNCERKPDDACPNDDRVPALHAFILAGAQRRAFPEKWVLRPAEKSEAIDSDWHLTNNRLQSTFNRRSTTYV